MRFPRVFLLVAAPWAMIGATSAHAGYLFDSYQSSSAETAPKVISVSAVEGNQIEIQTLCRETAGQLMPCDQPIRVSRERVRELAAAEQVQFDRLLASFERKTPAPAPKKSENGLASAAMAAMSLGFAYPPSAPVTIPLGALLGVIAAIEQAAKKGDAAASPALADEWYHPKLGHLTARSIEKALTSDVAMSDYRKRDAIVMARENIEDLFSDATYARITEYLQSRVNQRLQKDLAANAQIESSAQLPIARETQPAR